MEWPEAIVAHLCDLLRSGWPRGDFDGAWASAVRAYPPRGRDMGELRPSLFDEPDVSVVEFTRRVCEDSWYGRNDRLRNFHPDAVRTLRARETEREAIIA